MLPGNMLKVPIDPSTLQKCAHTTDKVQDQQREPSRFSFCEEGEVYRLGVSESRAWIGYVKTD